jgi:putative FmdB family regulatory protein
MPIYAYKCESCGHSKDVLQKISDAPLTECPACGKSTFAKQVTAAGFQLKGSGWYATDFKGGGSASAAAPATSDAAPAAKTDAKPADSTPAPAAPASTGN